MNRWKEGDVIENRRTGLVREIVDVLPTGYGWRFPDLDHSVKGNYFLSHEEFDSFMIDGWEFAKPTAGDYRTARHVLGVVIDKWADRVADSYLSASSPEEEGSGI